MVGLLCNSVCLLLIIFMSKSDSLIHFFHMFFKSCISFVLSNCLNAKKNHIWDSKYTIHHSIERSQTTKCIQYNIHNIKSCELPKYFLDNCWILIQNTFRIQNTEYIIALSVHKQPNVFHTTYTIQSRVNCPNVF